MHHLSRVCVGLLCGTLLLGNSACSDDTGNDTPKKDMSNQQDMGTNDMTEDMVEDMTKDMVSDMSDMSDMTQKMPCEANQNVVSGQCMACPAGTTNDAGDDPNAADTMCDATLCGENEYVQSNACEPCPAGSTNAAGDDASGTDTMCDPNLCGENEYVKSNECEPCPANTTNAANDDASGADTTCDDACLSVFGVSCDMLKQTYIKSSNPEKDDTFGQALDVSGNTLVVGARGEDSNSATDQSNNSISASGAVYVFVNNNGTWTQEAYLKASNPDQSDSFGGAVAIDGDTLVVGAPLESSNATGVNGDQNNNAAIRSGAAYVFKRANGTWTQQAYLKATNPRFEDSFGLSLAIHGDTIAVGAPFEDSGEAGINAPGTDGSKSSAGAVYVFTRTNDVWSHQAYIKSSNPDIEDRFGYSVALEGDTLAVGAYGEQSAATGLNGDQADNTADKRGAVYIFGRSNNVWSQQTYLKPSDVTSWFGWHVAMSGDTLAVGARFDAPGGAVYVFVNNNGTWMEQAKLKAPEPGSEDDFGHDVDIDGDIIVVGATREDSNATQPGGDQLDNSAQDSGAAYVFKRTNGTWSAGSYLKASNTDAFDLFGYGVCVSGNTAFVGAYVEQSNASGINGDVTNNDAQSAGAVYAFSP